MTSSTLIETETLANLLTAADHEDDSNGPAHVAARSALDMASEDVKREAQYVADARLREDERA